MYEQNEQEWFPDLPSGEQWRLRRAKEVGYLFMVEELPQWTAGPCPDCAPGSPWLSEEGHRAAHVWRKACRAMRCPFIPIVIYRSPNGGGGRSNGVVLLDAETMEPGEGGSTVELLMLTSGYPVSDALKEVGIRAKVTLVDQKRMRVDVASKDAVFAGLQAVDTALRQSLTWREPTAPNGVAVDEEPA